MKKLILILSLLIGATSYGATAAIKKTVAATTDNAVPVFVGTSGKLAEETPVLIDPATGNVTGIAALTASGAITGVSIDIGTTTLLTSRSLAIDTGGVFDISLGAASGDDFTIDTDSLVVEGDGGNVGVGTDFPDSLFHIKGSTPGTVGSHPAGQLIIQAPQNGPTGNAVIVAYESDILGNPDQQLWYLGSSSSSNDDVIFLNRSNANLSFNTNGNTSLVLDATGGVTTTGTFLAGVLQRSLTATLTASTTQTQGQQTTTTDKVFVDTIANDNDVVTARALVGGQSQTIYNDDAAQILQVFPASGDDIGAGINLSITVDPGFFVVIDGKSVSMANSTIAEPELQLIGTLTFDGGGSAIAVSTASDLPIGLNRNWTLTKVFVTSNPAGACTVQIRDNTPVSDVWSTPTTAETVSVLTGKNMVIDTTLAATFSAGDVIDGNISANGGNATNITVRLFGTPN